jgi:transposase
MAKMEALHLTPIERGELQIYLRKRNLPARVAQRMRIVLLLKEGTSYCDIEDKLGAAPSTVSRWKQRYVQDGVLSLATIHPGQPPQKLTPQLRAKVLERTRQAPPEPRTIEMMVRTPPIASWPHSWPELRTKRASGQRSR